MANIVNFTDKQFENRLNDNLEELIQGKKAVESPTAFLLGGQPGSGKTSLRSAIFEETQGNVIVIHNDTVMGGCALNHPVVPPTPSTPLTLVLSVPLPTPAHSHLVIMKPSLFPTLSTKLRPTWPLPLCSIAFVSKQEGTEVVKRLRRYLDHGLG